MGGTSKKPTKEVAKNKPKKKGQNFIVPKSRKVEDKEAAQSRETLDNTEYVSVQYIYEPSINAEDFKDSLIKADERKLSKAIRHQDNDHIAREIIIEYFNKMFSKKKTVVKTPIRKIGPDIFYSKEIKEITQQKHLPTVAGMALYLGTTRKTLIKERDNPDLGYTIRQSINFIEQIMFEAGFKNQANVTMLGFALKAIHGLNEKGSNDDGDPNEDPPVKQIIKELQDHDRTKDMEAMREQAKVIDVDDNLHKNVILAITPKAVDEPKVEKEDKISKQEKQNYPVFYHQ